MLDLEERAEATRKTWARFEGKPFDWTKAATCVHLMKYHGQNMGHTLPSVPRFRSAMSAKRALQSLGHDSVVSLMNEKFAPIVPAKMWVGDMMAVPGEAGFEALFIRAGVTKFIGWHEDVEDCVLVDTDIGQALGAWRL